MAISAPIMVKSGPVPSLSSNQAPSKKPSIYTEMPIVRPKLRQICQTLFGGESIC